MFLCICTAINAQRMSQHVKYKSFDSTLSCGVYYTFCSLQCDRCVHKNVCTDRCVQKNAIYLLNKTRGS